MSDKDNNHTMEVEEEVAEAMTEEAAEKMTEDVAEEVAKEMTEGVVEELTLTEEVTAEESSEEVAEEITVEAASDENGEIQIEYLRNLLEKQEAQLAQLEESQKKKAAEVRKMKQSQSAIRSLLQRVVPGISSNDNNNRNNVVNEDDELQGLLAVTEKNGHVGEMEYPAAQVGGGGGGEGSKYPGGVEEGSSKYPEGRGRGGGGGDGSKYPGVGGDGGGEGSKYPSFPDDNSNADGKNGELNDFPTKDDAENVHIPEDSFSFIMIASYERNILLAPVIVGWFVFFFQMVSYILILLNSITGESYNMFGFPANVHLNVQMAEVVALLVTCTIADDTRYALAFLFHGYFQVTFEGPYHENITFINWGLSVATRLLQGAAYVFLTFILVMKSDDVVDLLLNFSAMQFISELDDVAFFLSSKGFLGEGCKRLSDRVCETSYFSDENKDSIICTTRCKQFLNDQGTFSTFVFLIVLVPLLFGWILIRVNQDAGAYSCKTVFFQFGDDVLPEVGALGGRYLFTRSKGETSYYFNVDESIGSAHLRFCHEDSFWALTYSPNDEKPCDNWVIKSSSAEASEFDILMSEFSTWYVRNKENKEIIMEHFRMICFDCDVEDYCANGMCDRQSDTCICDPGWYGDRCDFHEPCQTIQIGDPTKQFVGFRQWSNTFERLETTNGYVDINAHPVYIGQSDDSQNEFDLMIFNGRRWFLTSTALFSDIHESGANTLTKETLLQYLQTEFSAFWSRPPWSFISDPVDLDTATDAATPVGLKWFQGGVSSLIELLGVGLVCIVCDDETNSCKNGGLCQSNSRCDCSNNGASGALCQIPPDQNGFCDPVFNSPEFNFDGGDCCQASCLSNDDITCGWDKPQTQYRHYCGCQDPAHTCADAGEHVCWKENSETIYGRQTNTGSGRSLALSADARILAVGEPGADSVRVFHIDGSQWVQMGATIQGEPESRFGESIAISGNGGLLAVGSPDYDNPDPTEALNKDRPTGRLSIYEYVNTWRLVDEVDAKITDKVFSGRLGASLAMSEDGRIVFCSVEGTRKSSGAIYGYERNETTYSYFKSEPFYLNDRYLYDMYYSYWGMSISISNSGNTLAFYASNTGEGSDVYIAKYEAPGSSEANSPGSLQLLEDASVPGENPLLSGDGTVVAVTMPMENPPQCQVYSWDPDGGINGNWTERGDALTGTAIALSSNALTLAVLFDDTSIRTYFWNGSHWNYQAEVTAADDASAILSRSLRGDDTVMAVGLPSAKASGRAKAGRTSVYHLVRKDEDVEVCERKSSLIQLDITTDMKPNETIWEIRDFFTRKLLWTGGPYGNQINDDEPETSISITETLYMPIDTSCADFTIYDTGGNGLCCGNGLGSYSLSYGGILEKIGAKFQWSDGHRFGNCQRTCAEGETLFSAEVTLDNYPNETTWELTNIQDGSVLFQGGPYQDIGATVTEELCIPSDVCANWMIVDAQGDGLCCLGGFGSYVVTVDGETIARGGEFLLNETVMIGDTCSLNVSDFVSLEEQSSLFVDLRSDETNWILYELGAENTTASNHSMQIDLTSGTCYLFEAYAAMRGDGIYTGGAYTLLLDDQEIFSGDTSVVSGNTYLIGQCQDVVTLYDISIGNSVACNDDVRNSCRAPAVCAPQIEPNGENVLGISLQDGFWFVDGAWSFTFQRDCNAACHGVCNTVLPIPFECEDDEMVFRFQIAAEATIAWIVRSHHGEVIGDGDATTLTYTIVHDRACIPTDTCTIFEMHGDGEYFLYLDGEFVLSDSSKDGFAAENVCPHLTGTSATAALTNNGDIAIDKDTTVVPGKEFCHHAKPLSLGVTVTDSTEDGIVDYIARCGDTTGSASPGVWYSVMGTGRELVANLCESSYDTQLSIFSGSCNSLVCIVGNDDYGYGNDFCDIQSRIIWNSTFGIEYLLFVHGFGIDKGMFSLHVSEAEPINDNCTNAVFLDLGTTVTGFTDIAEIDDVLDGIPSCGQFNSSNNTSPGVWYAVVGTGQEISASTCNSTEFDTMLTVFSGSCGSLACVETNDDTCNFQSRVNWDSMVGTTYYILVYGLGHESGQFMLDVDLASFKIGDTCDDARPLKLDGQVFSSTELATNDGNFSNTCARVVGGDFTEYVRGPGIWFLVSGTGNEMEARTCGSPLDTVITVFSGSCDSLVCVDQNDDFCGFQSVVTWSSIAEAKYSILVEGFSKFDYGDFNLVVREVS